MILTNIIHESKLLSNGPLCKNSPAKQDDHIPDIFIYSEGGIAKGEAKIIGNHSTGGFDGTDGFMYYRHPVTLNYSSQAPLNLGSSTSRVNRGSAAARISHNSSAGLKYSVRR